MDLSKYEGFFKIRRVNIPRRVSPGMTYEGVVKICRVCQYKRDLSMYEKCVKI